MVKDIVTEADVAEAVDHYVFGAGTVQRESKTGKKSYRGLGAEARVRSSLVELFEPELRRVKLSQVESSRAVSF